MVYFSSLGLLDVKKNQNGGEIQDDLQTKNRQN
jgi:hypothetical protein